MKCPHCLTTIHEDWNSYSIASTQDTRADYRYSICPECKKFIIQINVGHRLSANRWLYAYPKAISRSPLPPELNDPYVSSDYTEACLVLSDSAKASAALSRRCLQHILREKADIKKGDLNDEIQEVLDGGNLPSDIADNLDAVRNIGNFAAHPIKSKSTGEIVDVEPNEAEWNLEVLEQLIDFYYVRPAIAKKKRDELNVKLTAAGKPMLKSSKTA